MWSLGGALISRHENNAFDNHREYLWRHPKRGQSKQMATVLRRSPAKRRGQSTQILASDLALLGKDVNASPAIRRRKSDASIGLSKACPLWSIDGASPFVESTHILEEIVQSEDNYVAELRSIFTTIIRPHRIAQVNGSACVAPVAKSTVVTPKKGHGRSGSLFSMKDRECSSPTPAQLLADRLKDPMTPEANYLERAYRSIETMIKSHSAMLSAFKDSKNPSELVSAFIIHLESLLLVYRAFVLTLPYIHTLLPQADDTLTNKLSGYSRFLSPMQRAIKYELLFRRLALALHKEGNDRKLQTLVKSALRSAEQFCQSLDAVQQSEQAKIYLGTLSSRIGADLTHKTLLYEGPVISEALSSKKGCKINYAILFTDGTVYWNSTPADQDRIPKSWVLEMVTKIEEGGCLDIIVHTDLQRLDKVKTIRRAIGFVTPSRPPSVLGATPEGSRKVAKQGAMDSITVLPDVLGEKKRRKEGMVEEWLSLGQMKDRTQSRTDVSSALVETRETVRSPVIPDGRGDRYKVGYF